MASYDGRAAGPTRAGFVGTHARTLAIDATRAMAQRGRKVDFMFVDALVAEQKVGATIAVILLADMAD